MSRQRTPGNYVIAVAAGYSEKQIRPFLASLAQHCPNVALRLIIARPDPVFEQEVRAWIPNSEFHPFPPMGLRDFALRHKHVRSVFRRLTRWLPPPNFSKRLLQVHYARYLMIRDLVRNWGLNDERVILVDSRDSVFQSNPFVGDWPDLWTGEEDKRIEECTLNSFWFRRIGGAAAFEHAKKYRIVCSGVVGGTGHRIGQYTSMSSEIIERLAPRIALDRGDQGVHNNLVRLAPELGFHVLENGDPLVANIGTMRREDLIIQDGTVLVRDRTQPSAVLHQYDRHPELVELVNEKWGAAPEVSGSTAKTRTLQTA